MSARRALSIVVLLTLVATWVPATAATLPSASEVLLDVAAHSPNLIIRINTLDELWEISVMNPYVRVHMMNAILRGSWILTTRTTVTSGRWTGRPWLAIGGNARYFYFAHEAAAWVGDGSDAVGDQGGAVTAADGKSVSEFGANLTAIGEGIAALAAAKGNTKGVAIGVGIAGLGVTINAVGLGLQIAEDVAARATSPKQGHVDTEGPTGMPAAGGPPGSDPNGPTGQSPPGAVGVTGGGVSGGGGEGGGGDVGDPGDD